MVTAMSAANKGAAMKFSALYAKDAPFGGGLRACYEYRDLGIAAATGARVLMHVIRAAPAQHAARVGGGRLLAPFAPPGERTLALGRRLKIFVFRQVHRMPSGCKLLFS
jgi:hypothetical protein